MNKRIIFGFLDRKKNEFKYFDSISWNNCVETKEFGNKGPYYLTHLKDFTGIIFYELDPAPGNTRLVYKYFYNGKIHNTDGPAEVVVHKDNLDCKISTFYFNGQDMLYGYILYKGLFFQYVSKGQLLTCKKINKSCSEYLGLKDRHVIVLNKGVFADGLNWVEAMGKNFSRYYFTMDIESYKYSLNDHEKKLLNRFRFFLSIHS